MTEFQEKCVRAIARGEDPYKLSRLSPGVSKALNNLRSAGFLGPWNEGTKLSEKGLKYAKQRGWIEDLSVECRCAGHNYCPDEPCLVHPKRMRS